VTVSSRTQRKLDNAIQFKLQKRHLVNGHTGVDILQYQHSRLKTFCYVHILFYLWTATPVKTFCYVHILFY